MRLRRQFGTIFGIEVTALLLMGGLVAFVAKPADSSTQAKDASKKNVGPTYTDDGLLRRPQDFDTWVFVGASLGLSYSDHAAEYGDELFHNVYLDPHAYQEYKRTGAFPDKTMLAMVVYRGSKKASHPPKLQGIFEDELVALEVAVKDSRRFEEGWAYFDFGGPPHHETAKAFPAAKCYNCHAEHAADDNVFVQFYPVLRAVKPAKGLGSHERGEDN